MKKRFGDSVPYIALYGCITGVFCGGIIALFIVCAKVIFGFTFGLYAGANTALVVVCLITLAFICCVLTAVIQTLCPRSKGSGIPLAECAARGILKVKWLSAAASLIAGSLLAFLSGMPLGSEGPSIGVGGLVGEGVGSVAKKPIKLRRYLITGGASAGLAVAVNAPLSGVCFAIEETHRRFSPYILAAAVSTVVTAVLTSQTVFYALSFVPYLKELGVGVGLCMLSFLSQVSYASAADLFSVSGYAMLCGILCAGIGIGFNRGISALSALFDKVKNRLLRLLPAFLLACAAGLALYYNIGPGEAALHKIVGAEALWVAIAVLLVRLVTTAVASGAGATGGLFIPMIAIGGLAGVVAANLGVNMGISEIYTPNIIIICVSAFFAASVRAPVTGIVLSVELTASFVNILPCMIAVAIASLVSEASKTMPLYEKMAEAMLPPKKSESISVRGILPDGSPIADKTVRDIMWPHNSLVVGINRGGMDILPDGDTVLLAGDEITVRSNDADEQFFYEQLRDYIRFDIPE